MGKSEQREFANRMAVLLVHLLKWSVQPERCGKSWQGTMREQRKMIARRLAKTPSLKADVADPDWFEDVWSDAKAKAFEEPTSRTCPKTVRGRRRKYWI